MRLGQAGSLLCRAGATQRSGSGPCDTTSPLITAGPHQHLNPILLECWRCSKREACMLLKGRKQARAPERMLVQISAVRGRRLEELAPIEGPNPRGVRIKTQRPWEPGCHVDLKVQPGELGARARVVYCQALGPKTFVVGLNFLQTNGHGGDARTKPDPARRQNGLNSSPGRKVRRNRSYIGCRNAVPLRLLFHHLPGGVEAVRLYRRPTSHRKRYKKPV